jgi:hypothetical protein
MARALQARRVIALVVTIALTLSACGGFDRDISVVKQSNAPTGIANEELVRQIAGARGKIVWSAERPEKYKDNENIVLVRATVDRVGRSGAKHEVVMDWIHNRQTEKVDLEGLKVDGEERSVVGGALQVLLLQLD